MAVSRIYAYAVAEAGKLLPDGHVRFLPETSCLSVTSAAHGDLKCFYDDRPDMQVAGITALDTVVLKHLGARILREAYADRVMPHRADFDTQHILNDEVNAAMVELVARNNACESHVRALCDTLAALTEENRKTQAKLLETLDALLVCETRLNSVEFGDSPPPPSHKRARTDEHY
jgi:hypothetical protein